MILAGIDYSITSPAICILDTTTNKHHYYNLCSVNKALKNSKSEIIDLTPYPIWNTDMERYDLISEWALNVLKDNNVEMLAIEGYAMGARAGLVCNIAENGGILRFKLHKAGIPFTVYAPTQVKKFITTKGNAKKDEVIDCVEKETMISFADELGLKQYSKPADDLADSYAIVKLLERNMNAPDSK